MPFLEIYQILRSASAETLRSYCDELEHLPLGPARNAALTAFFKTLVQANASKAKELFFQLKKEDRWLPMWAIREAAPPRGMEAVAEVLLSFDRIEISSCSHDLLGESLDDWGKNDPLALKQFLESHRGQDIERYFDRLVRNWAAYDPETARQWMLEEVRNHPVPPPVAEGESQSMEDSEWRSAVEQMSSGWIEGYLANDATGAMNYVLEHADSPEVEQALYSFGGDLFIMSPKQACDFISHLPGTARLHALQGVANKADPLVQNEANDNITSPRYVAEWLLQFPAQERQFPNASDVIETVLRSWEAANSHDLFAWMADLPSQTRETIVQSFPTYATEEHAQEDFDSIMQADDPVLRMQLLEKLMRNARSARIAMLDVVERAEITPEEKIHLVSLIPTSDEDQVEAAESKPDEN